MKEIKDIIEGAIFYGEMTVLGIVFLLGLIVGLTIFPSFM